MARFRRLLGIVLWRMGGEPSAERAEAMASMSLYGTSTRRTFAAPTKRPGSAANAPGLTGGEISDAEHDDA